MTRSARCRLPTPAVLHDPLLKWYERAKRDLPWRRTRDPYRIWLSEVMLQQTRVESVIPYYERFLTAFPSVAALAAAPLDAVLKGWEGLGYYARARNLHRAAQAVVNRHEGRIPLAAAQLAELPGIGRYTAAAIASIAAGEPAAALDGNIKRVVARLFRVDAPIDRPATVRELWRLADQCLAREAPGDWNQALMELGATLCAPRAPRCAACPLRPHCAAAAAGVQHSLPRKGRRPTSPVKRVAVGVVRGDTGIFIVRRPERGLLGGLWGFPSVPIDRVADAAAALRAALRETYALRAVRLRLAAEIEHVFTHFKLIAHVLVADARGSASQTAGACWADAVRFRSLALARVDRKILKAVTDTADTAGGAARIRRLPRARTPESRRSAGRQ